LAHLNFQPWTQVELIGAWKILTELMTGLRLTRPLVQGPPREARLSKRTG